jgi:hypothetical protein
MIVEVAAFEELGSLPLLPNSRAGISTTLRLLWPDRRRMTDYQLPQTAFGSHHLPTLSCTRSRYVGVLALRVETATTSVPPPSHHQLPSQQLACSPTTTISDPPPGNLCDVLDHRCNLGRRSHAAGSDKETRTRYPLGGAAGEGGGGGGSPEPPNWERRGREVVL